MKVRAATVALLVVIAAVAGCERERRDFGESPSGATAIASLRMSHVAGSSSNVATPLKNDYEDNAYALAEGKRLFHWYNCSGCHAEGGGDKGPALMDNVWIYGSEPADVFATIVQGRPNGMPAWGGRIPEKEVWELVAYVRSLSGLVSKQAAPNRADAIQAREPESNMDRQPAVKASTPKP